MNKSQMVKCVREAKAEFKTRGLSFARKPLVSQFSTGGMAPKSRKEALQRATKARDHYLDLLRRVEDMQGNKLAMQSEISAAKCFSMMKVVEDPRDVGIEGYDIDETPTIVFPVMHASGSRAPKNRDDYFHWGWVEYSPKAREWFADAWGVMFWSKSLREVVAFVYAQAIAEGLFCE